MNLVDLLREPDDDTIARFLETWHGRLVPPVPDAAPGPQPQAIRRLVAVIRPSDFVQNTLEWDPEWARDGDKRVFYVENQGVHVWATDGDGDDAVVWGRFNQPGAVWLAEREPLSQFLLQVVLFEAIMGAAHGASAASITLSQLEAAVAPLERLLGCWRWPLEPSCFYAGADILAFAGPNGRSREGSPDDFSLFVAARHPDALSYLRDLAGIEWTSGPGAWWSRG